MIMSPTTLAGQLRERAEHVWGGFTEEHHALYLTKIDDCTKVADRGRTTADVHTSNPEERLALRAMFFRDGFKIEEVNATSFRVHW